MSARVSWHILATFPTYSPSVHQVRAWEAISYDILTTHTPSHSHGTHVYRNQSPWQPPTPTWCTNSFPPSPALSELKQKGGSLGTVRWQDRELYCRSEAWSSGTNVPDNLLHACAVHMHNRHHYSQPLGCTHVEKLVFITIHQHTNML